MKQDKVKMFSRISQAKLEEEVNEFIKDKKVKNIALGGSDRENVLVWYEVNDNE